MDVRLRMLAAPALVVLLFGSGAQLARSATADQGRTGAKTVSVGGQKEIATVLATLRKSLDDENALAVASLFSEDAIFIDQSGKETHGRTSLQQGFDAQFKSRHDKPKVNVEFAPEKVTFPAENVALVVGSANKVTGEESTPLTRFSMFMEKRNGQWLISEATETRIQTESSAHEHLTDLNWLLGSWKINSEQGLVHVRVEWAPGGNFLRASSVTTEAGVEKADTEIIGWDERTSSIVSWTFGYGGNFSYSKWKQDGNQWTVNIAGVNSDGSDVVSKVILTPKTADTFAWQAAGRVVAGNTLPDTPELLVERVPGDRK